MVTTPKYWWMDVEFPIADVAIEPDWRHFETLRKYCWLKTHIDAGEIAYTPVTQINGDLTNATWETFVNGMNSADFPTNEIWYDLCDIRFVGQYEAIGRRV